MSEIAELEGRIAAAMARIGQAVEGIGAGSGVSAEELDQARGAAESAGNEARQATERAEAAEAEVARLIEALEAETTAGAQLRERVGSLKSMKDRQQERISELESALAEISEQRSADRQELDGLIAALEPLVREQTDA